MSPVEVREDEDGTDGLIAYLLRGVQGVYRDDVVLRGEEWRVEAETPYSLLLTQWTEHDYEKPTGPRVRVTLTVHVEEVH